MYIFLLSLTNLYSCVQNKKKEIINRCIKIKIQKYATELNNESKKESIFTQIQTKN